MLLYGEGEESEAAALGEGVRTTHKARRCFMESDKNMQMYVKLFFWGDGFNSPPSVVKQ